MNGRGEQLDEDDATDKLKETISFYSDFEDSEDNNEAQECSQPISSRRLKEQVTTKGKAWLQTSKPNPAASSLRKQPAQFLKHLQNEKEED